MQFRFFGDGSRLEFNIPVIFLSVTSVKVSGAITSYTLTNPGTVLFEAAPVMNAPVDIEVVVPVLNTGGTGGGVTLEEIQAETISQAELEAAIATIQQDPILAGDIRMFQEVPGGWVAIPNGMAPAPILTSPQFISLGLSPTGGGGNTGRHSSWKGNDGNYYFADETGIVYKYNKTTKVWSTTAARPSSINRHGVAPLADGRALFVGGRISAAYSALCHIYNPSTDAWTAVADYPVAAWYTSACLLSDGNVLAVGGTASGGNTQTAHVYNPVANTWTEVAVPPATAAPPFLVPLEDGKALANVGSAYRIYDSVNNSWTDVTFSPNPGNTSAACHLGNNNVWFWNSSALGPLVVNPITGQQGYIPNPSYRIATTNITKARQTCYLDGDDIILCGHISSTDLGSRSQWLIRNARLNLPVYFARKT